MLVHHSPCHRLGSLATQCMHKHTSISKPVPLSRSERFESAPAIVGLLVAKKFGQNTNNDNK
eukprot:m.322095 g.322095  ORF g.322095 m.322095 type:complete len:62 (+) comp19713_c0_seq37:1809-1994(+)